MKKLIWLAVFAIVVSASSCSNDDLPISSDTPVDINTWIYEVMDEVYLWTDELPGSPDLNVDPEVFFEDLLSDEDRFSIIHPDYNELVSALNGVNTEAGYEFRVVRTSTNQIFAAITYIKSGSQADAAGLRRGDRISGINGSVFTEDNYRQLLTNEIKLPHDIDYLRYDETIDDYIVQNQVSVSTTEFGENPNFLDTVYQINGRRIGYYVYNFFADGQNDVYRDQMDNIISGFSAQGINDLVLDLRYNGGGFISTATNLASLIVSGAGDEDIFFQNQWNDEIQSQIEGQSNGDEILRQRFFEKSQNIGQQIGGRLYVLVGSRTASASELVINGLLPFMDVILIGESTIGKNVGSIALEDEDNDENDYGLLPIVFRSANANGNSDYGQGFFPESSNEIFELNYPLLPLGDTNERLLAQAIGLITGQSLATRVAKNEQLLESLMSSRDLKSYAQRSILETKP